MNTATGYVLTEADRLAFRTRLKLAEQALVSHQAKLPSAVDKDGLRRSIKVTKSIIHDLKEALK